jgi:hypothetical protein
LKWSKKITPHNSIVKRGFSHLISSGGKAGIVVAKGASVPIQPVCRRFLHIPKPGVADCASAGAIGLKKAQYNDTN